MSRRLLLANSHEGGGTSLEFPIYLVEGDNGQVGVDLYNYINNNYTVNEYGSRYYHFSENETVFFSAFGITEKLTYMYKYNYTDEIYVATLSQFGNSSMVLSDTGNITVNWA